MNIDRAVPPAERDRLVEEQRAAFGVDKVVIPQEVLVAAGMATGASARPGDASPGDDSDSGRPTSPDLVEVKPRLPQSPGDQQPETPSAWHRLRPHPEPEPLAGGEPTQDPGPDGGGAPLPTIGNKPDPGTSVRSRNEQIREYARTHDYWVDMAGEVWRLELEADDSVVLERNNDSDGELHQNPTNVSYSELVDESGKVLDEAALEQALRDAQPSDHVPAPGPVDAPQPPNPDSSEEQPITLRSVIRIARTGPDVAHLSSSGRVVIGPDDSVTQDLSRSVTLNDGTEIFSRGIEVFGTTPEDYGRETVSSVRAHGVDGSRVQLIERVSKGSLAPPVEPVTLDSVTQEQQDELNELVLLFNEHVETTVTWTDADGSTRTTSSESARPRATPGTMAELASLQDELSTAEEVIRHGRALDVGTDGTVGAGDFINIATQMESILDRDSIQKAVLAGAQGLGASDPEAVHARADEVLAETRERFEAWGLDVSDGNELIDREWLDDDDAVIGNAYYDHEEDEIHFGLGFDGTPFALSDDIIVHEFTHRLVMKNSDGMPYRDQHGAVNESLADTMAAALDDDWVLGEDVTKGGARDMSVEVTMSDYLEMGRIDNGGVHINSAIPNHAAFLIGDELGREKLGAIYARTIDEHLDKDTDFRKLATGTWKSAIELYGIDSAEVRAVIQAWDGVLELKGDMSLFSDRPAHRSRRDLD